ncbi:putative transcriptional regulatory protein [Diplogelasinospora grovesii]|uniref:Transcriptional regulatory protein n=1 Tax=Diplogelasinospora grovesii TaxID=303347 RepID=A0AAN6S5H1_9PEZI|nr:putative transcriptional regulatory protein [Diplogelasinospora grovesii]
MSITSLASGTSVMPVAPHSGSVSPRTAVPPKNVAFELLFAGTLHRARLPLRVSIYPHDSTDSIVTTVKNFYGLYSSPTISKGVSFEDEQGNTLIARYENFHNNMVVYVRVIDEASPVPEPFSSHNVPNAPVGAQGYYHSDNTLQPPLQNGHHISRPTSRTSRRRSPSPNIGRGRRSVSAGTNPTASKKGRSRSSKTGASQANGDLHNESHNGYSSGDGAPGSSSGKTKEQLGNTEISVENIVEGGRRKRAKFESSELPLFAPPQMPAATSNPSVSPARRIEHNRQSLPFAQPGQNPFTNPRALPSPQSYTNGIGYASGMFATPAMNGGRTRGSFGYSNGSGVGPGMSAMPTPDPTVGSCMSEEDKDVAMQLMRLGEMSSIPYGRTSASTVDETFSGKADADSSLGGDSDAGSDREADMPPARRQKLDPAGAYQMFQTPDSKPVLLKSVEGSDDEVEPADNTGDGAMAAPRPRKLTKNTLNGAKARSQSSSSKVKPKASKPKTKKAPSTSGPMSPASLPHSRKQSIASNPAFSLMSGDDDQPDLSTKPRCQRCRKSKKGCDRQRPCGRCRDAGIPAEQCISEDEGNGRKGRYGRHMGVPIKKEDGPSPVPALLPAAPIAAAAPALCNGATSVSTANCPPPPLPAAAAALAADKSKKRKR